MKNLFLLVLLAVCSHSLFSQVGQPPYKQQKFLPDFELLQADNSKLSSGKLKKGAPTIIMFFSPGCDHCIKQFEDMVKRQNDLKNHQIVMATIQPIEEIQEFVKKYKISSYPNYTVGKDEKFFLPPFFQIQNFPYLAFYDKNGKLISTFEGNLTVDEIQTRYK